MNIWKRVLIIMVIGLLGISAFAVGNCDGAGNCYVSNIATGTGTGADWRNACTDFIGPCDVTSVSMRGTTIYVGGTPGNWLGAAYTAQNFSAPANGTIPITIIGATAENHGTNTGWQKPSASGMIAFTGPINITTDYWVFNGGNMRAPGGATYHDQYFGHHMMVSNANNSANGAIQVSGSHVTLEYISVFGSSGNYFTSPSPTPYGTTATDNGIYFSPGVTDEYVGYSWIANTGADLISASSGSNFTFEHNTLGRNHGGVAAQKSSAFNIGDISNLIIRYNNIYNITNTAILTDGHADATAFSPNWYFSGYDIVWTSGSNLQPLPPTANYGLTSGIVNLTGETLNGGVIQVYNNTIFGINAAACTSTISCNSSALNLNGATGGSCAAHTQNCIGGTGPVGTVYNNLWWNPYKAQNITVNTAGNPQWTPVGDYGEGICATTGCTNGGSFTVVGANDVALNSGNPFTSTVTTMGTVNWWDFNFGLTADTPAGLTIPNWSTTPAGCTSGINCEDTDSLLRVRRASGVVDRGTHQRNPRVLLTVAMQNRAFGLHVGSTFTQTPVCTWSSAPTSDNCPDGVAPFIKRWVSLDTTVATVNSTGVVTGISPHNTVVRLYYGGISSYNNTIAVVTDGLGTEPIAALPTGIVRTGSPLAFSGYDTTAFDAAFPTNFSDPCPVTVTGGCTRWKPLTSAQLVTDLTSSQPGDTIELQAGTTYATAGRFLMPARANPSHKWTYIVSSTMSSLPHPGTRISPNDVANMPQVEETGNSLLFVAAAGADHWWIAGIELIGAAPIHQASGAMVGTLAYTPPASPNMPDSITVDRCYMHTNSAPGAGGDMLHTIIMNASHFALLDSYVGPGLQHHTQGNAGTLYFSPGPLKIINNFFSSLGNGIIIGGAGGWANPWLVSDVYISHNTFWADPAWRKVGFSVPPAATYEVVNNLELKMCQRCLIDGNLMQNMWGSAQAGTSVVFNTVTSVQGPNAVNDDITFSNNIITGALQGIGVTEFGATGLGCDATGSPCQYVGESRRVNFFNNLYLQGPQGPPGGRAGGFPVAGSITRLKSDSVWQHNTFVGPYLTDHDYCEKGFYFSILNNYDTPPTQNMWLLDNVSCRQTSGFSSLAGTALLNSFMGDPASVPVSTRYYGNVMQVFPARGDKVQTWPTGNVATTNDFTYVDKATGNYQLVSPAVTGSDGYQSGINYKVLIAHQAPPLGSCSIRGTVSGAVTSGSAISITGGTTSTAFADPSGNYSFTVAPGSYVITPFMPGLSFSPISIPVTVTSTGCSVTGQNFTSTR